VLLRIEDVDRGRARADIADSQREDLQWLGCGWDEEVQSQGLRDYGPWLDLLSDRTYHCCCSRKQLKACNGHCPCRDLDLDAGAVRFRLASVPVVFEDRRHGRIEAASDEFPDPVLRRSDGIHTYNLAVVADDIADGVTEVVRGSDLLLYTAVQIQLWRAFGATPPSWLHTPIVVGADGRKLSKSHGDVEIRTLRERGWTAASVWRTVLPWLGLDDVEDLEAAATAFDPTGGDTQEILWINASET